MKQILQTAAKKSNKKEWMKNESIYETRKMVKKGITKIVHTKSLKKCSFPDSFLPGLLKCSLFTGLLFEERGFTDIMYGLFADKRNHDSKVTGLST